MAVHFISSYFSLYWFWKVSWLSASPMEVLVHILSGVWVASLVLWLASVWDHFQSLNEYKIRSFLIAIISALIMGALWELTESYSQIILTSGADYVKNTILDLTNDILGGILAYLYFIKRKKCLDESSAVLHDFYNKIGVTK